MWWEILPRHSYLGREKNNTTDMQLCAGGLRSRLTVNAHLRGMADAKGKNVRLKEKTTEPPFLLAKL